MSHVRILHISDWHGQLRPLPPADIYAVTGDMLPNFPLERIALRAGGELETYDPYDPRSGPRPAGAYAGRKVDRRTEEVRQLDWCLQRPFRRETCIPEDAPVLVVRGNHDFIPLADWIGGDVWEVDDDPTRTTDLLGLRFGGLRGIDFIRGEWADELREEELADRARALPEDLDVLLSHVPPAGVLDLDQHGRGWGSQAVAAYVNRRGYGRPLRAHLFGHVHSSAACEGMGGTVFSNAACAANVVVL